MIHWLRSVIREVLHRLVDEAIDQAEKRCIQAICSHCCAGHMPEFHDDYRTRAWEHSSFGLRKNWFHCPAHGIYELRRIRAAVKEASE